MDEEQFDNLMERVHAGQAATLDEAREALDWMLDEGVTRYPKFTAQQWLFKARAIVAKVTVSTTVRSLLEQDDENDLYRILTDDQGYIIRAVGDVLMNDDPAFLDQPAEWHTQWMWVLGGTAPGDKWWLLSDDDRDAVWARAAVTGAYLPDEMEAVYQEVHMS